MKVRGKEKLSKIYKRKGPAMKIKTNIKAGDDVSTNRITANHNEKLESDKKIKSLIVKTGIKAGEDKPPVIKRIGR